MSGWYVMKRGWMDNFKPEPFTEREAFMWSIEQAAIKAHDQWFNGQPIAVSRGEFATSLRTMEKAFGWSIKRVRGFMERMSKDEKWAHRQAHSGAQSPTIISVCNYDKYQQVPGRQGTAEGTEKGTRGAQSGHSRGTQQNKGNKGNNGNKEDSPSDSSIGEPIDAPPADLSRSLVVDEAGPAFAAYVATRRECVPAARSIDLTPARRAKLVARLAEAGGPGGWDAVLAQIRGSPFLRGDNRSGKFIAEIDWLLKPENLRKVREGNYDERPGPRRTGKPALTTPVDAARIARARLGLDGP